MIRGFQSRGQLKTRNRVLRNRARNNQVRRSGVYNGIIGIDLGTTYSCVATMEGDAPKVIENNDGDRTTPSYVAFTKDGERLVGVTAKRQAVTNPKNTFYSTKRLIGRSFNEPEIQEMAKDSSFKIVKSPNNEDAWVEDGNGKQYPPSKIGSMVLTKMKETAEDYLGQTVNKAVVTVPAYFNNDQRQATKDAGTIANLEVERIVNEPTAAALAYGLKQQEGKIAVYDLGGGTFDISTLEIEEGVFEVLSTHGDTFLGGEDFDSALIQHFVDEFKKQEGIDLSKDPLAFQRLKERAEQTKMELSSKVSTEVALPYIANKDGTPLHLNITVSRAKFEELVRPLIERTLEPCKDALKKADLDTEELDEVLLVGGMTRMPAVREAVKKYFNKDPYKGVNPDEAVAKGAALQGGILSGHAAGQNIVLLDVTPLSLGIETMGSAFEVIIPANTTIPHKDSKTFTTAQDNQSTVEIKVFQGERPIATDNKLLGQFLLSGIPAAPKGIPKIDVTFDINANGIVNVSAKEQTTNTEANIEIKSDGGLSKEEIDRMKQEAEQNAEADKKRRDDIETRNRSEQEINTIETQVEDYKEQITDDEKKQITDLIGKAKAALNTNDAEQIKQGLEDLKSVANEVFKRAYTEKQKGSQEGGEQK